MESNCPETSRNLFLDQKKPMEYRSWTRRVPGCPHGWGVRPPPCARPLARGQPGAPPMYFFLPYIPIYPKNFGEHNRSGVLPPKASIATKSQSRPVPAPCRRGQSFSGGHLHHPGALHDEEGVVLPRGSGYVPVVMCLIFLSLDFLRWHDLDVSPALL